jgi:hypothetical protein
MVFLHTRRGDLKVGATIDRRAAATHPGGITRKQNVTAASPLAAICTLDLRAARRATPKRRAGQNADTNHRTSHTAVQTPYRSHARESGRYVVVPRAWPIGMTQVG